MSSGSSSSHRRSGSNNFSGVKLHREMPRYCDCGYMVAVQTSWTATNPGRRFVACPERGVSGCRFFNWCDPEMCDRSKQIIPGLLKRINYLEAQVPLEVSALVKKISELESQLQQQSDGNRGKRGSCICIA
ncbi:PREDICTED: uncharacterized protein LOC105961843 [Erythranthe guttata]|uniref:uncharacterized protein LOC105961843 n=1 Tax=Erythranthe guttata TaxID=4155 RepID=UPI00064E0F43|nr:PREDICTED: uncharacterized protein LOC105961843 [Erythranthe guttata]|eukprot:XP_012841561.1 PREDICTED: uncharacterized protein LOC105961843 [Erythranthe guttata]